MIPPDRIWSGASLGRRGVGAPPPQPLAGRIKKSAWRGKPHPCALVARKPVKNDILCKWERMCYNGISRGAGIPVVWGGASPHAGRNVLVTHCACHGYSF